MWGCLNAADFGCSRASCCKGYAGSSAMILTRRVLFIHITKNLGLKQYNLKISVIIQPKNPQFNRQKQYGYQKMFTPSLTLEVLNQGEFRDILFSLTMNISITVQFNFKSCDLIND
eukprot:TRINITY_DN26086_c0_g1_i5.p2 TRINITY_DN26086_c0_g1~~TRINITY_DN26086_c0_g1_i5.p2  ORF type:complete len:116 (+),score=1.17 TRINITY_DN26086_c0_g1_i5:85-432(+)